MIRLFGANNRHGRIAAIRLNEALDVNPLKLEEESQREYHIDESTERDGTDHAKFSPRSNTCQRWRTERWDAAGLTAPAQVTQHTAQCPFCLACFGPVIVRQGAIGTALIEFREGSVRGNIPRRTWACICQCLTADGAPFSPCRICMPGFVKLTTANMSWTLVAY
jgi:hypothetical protein